jgi:hypothetical protein
MDSHIGNNPKFEIELSYKISTEYGDFNLYGRIDIMDSETVWEIKCTSEIKLEHLIQLVVYAWIYTNSMSDNKKFKIINLISGEINELLYDAKYVNKIINILFENKYGTKKKNSDKMFLKKCEKIYLSYNVDIDE